MTDGEDIFITKAKKAATVAKCSVESAIALILNGIFKLCISELIWEKKI